MKTIDTLIPDIYALFNSGHEPSPEALKHLGEALAQHIANAFKKREAKGFLRGSGMGETCDRRTWYQVNEPEEAEEVNPEALLKFLYGHLLEELVLFLAEEAKHKVEARQHTVNVNGVEGHIDAIIDGVLVDAKSANSRGMEKFKYHKLEYDDPFGYLGQLDFYRLGMIDDPRLKDKNNVAFLAIDKELGHLVLDKYARTRAALDEARANVEIKQAVASSPRPPRRLIEPVPDGKSGNMALATKCRYCDRKNKCWSDTNGGRGLRKFVYSNGPRWLTHVVREPDVKEEA